MEGREKVSELVRRAQLGDELAWDTLYKKSWTRVLMICRRFNRQDEEDLAQAVMVRMFEKIHTFKGTAQFSTWLHRVAVNVCLMARRKKRIHMMQPPDDLETYVPDERDWEAAAIARLDLDKIVPTLPLGYKRMLVVRDWFGYDTLETAAIIKRTESCVKSQLKRGRERAKQELKAKAAGAE